MGVPEVALERPVVLEGLAERRIVEQVRRHVDGREEARDVGARPVPLDVAQQPVQRGVDRGGGAGRGRVDPLLVSVGVGAVAEGRIF